jgi:hypothetical protein
MKRSSEWKRKRGDGVYDFDERNRMKFMHNLQCKIQVR